MEWVSIKDKLPNGDCICVVHNINRPGCIYIATYNKYFNEFEVHHIGISRLYDPITFNASHYVIIDFNIDKCPKSDGEF